ncbi:MAG TPA: AAA family ATPase [Candidatus Saccharimonadales bacterium]
MDSRLVVHPLTKQHVAQFLKTPVHALMIVGSDGIGKGAIAAAIAAAVLQVDPEKLDQYPYFKRSLPDEKATTSIETIRGLQRFLQLRTTGQGRIRRIIILEHAGTMTTEAQNAFLKVLEEPPTDTLIILTADSQRAVLPTILSRVQIMTIATPTEEAIRAHFSSLGREAAAITQSYFLSGGLPGLMHALLHEESDHPLLAGVAQAKALLQNPLFERLALVESMVKQKGQVISTLEALQHIAQTGLNQATDKQDQAKIKQWHHVLKLATEALQALAANANTKLTLSNLALRLN